MVNPADPDAQLAVGLWPARQVNDPQAALGWLDRATRAEPDLPTAYQARIEADWKLGRWDDLLADADRYRAVCGPDGWEAEWRYYRGPALQQLGRHPEAVGELTAGLAAGGGGVRAFALEARAVSLSLTARAEAARDDRAAAKQDRAAVVPRLQYLLVFPPGGQLPRGVAQHARDLADVAAAANRSGYEAVLYALAQYRMGTRDAVYQGA
ncbi:MAG: hypothetical protein K2X87_05080 [Gemmataceae bacterium]|nr:hypothetical protein [Gemmataceae bacterium]